MAAASDTSSPAAAQGSRFSVASLGRHALLYAIGGILTKAVAFVMLPVYTRYLTPADYGVAALIEMTLDVIALVGGAQIAQGVFRFYHKADSDLARRAVISTTLTMLSISYGVLSAAIFVSAGFISRLVFESDVHTQLIQLAAGSFALQGVILVAMAFGRVQERSLLVVGVSIVRLFVAVGLNILFIVVLGLGLRGMFLSSLGANLVLAIWLAIWTVRQVGIGIRLDVLRDLIRYGVPLIGVQAATFTMTFSDRYFLQAAGNETTVGLYNLAYQFGFLLLMLGFIPIEMIWGPRRFQVARSPDPSPALAKGFRLINVSVFTVGVGIALFVSDVLRIMSTPPFHPAADVVPIILVAYVFHGWAQMHDIGVLVKERTEYLTIANWVAALVALGAFAVLIPRFLAFGAAFAAVLAFSVRWGLTYFFSQRLWRVQYDWAPLARLAVAAAVVVGTGLFLPRLGLVASIALHSLLFLAYLVLLLVLPILTPGEKQAAVQIVRRRLRLGGRDVVADTPSLRPPS